MFRKKVKDISGIINLQLVVLCICQIKPHSTCICVLFFSVWLHKADVRPCIQLLSPLYQLKSAIVRYYFRSQHILLVRTM